MHRIRQVAMGVAGFLLAGCGQGSADSGLDVPSLPARPAADGHRHVLDVDWVPFSEAQIYEESLAVVRGRVVDQRYGIHRTHPVDGRSDDDAELPLTTSFVEVDEPFSDGNGAIGRRSIIQIVQLGGRYSDGCWVEPNDQHLLVLNEEIVAFLRPAGMVPIDGVDRASAYAIVGGQQGLVPVRNGLLDPIPSTVFGRYARRPVADLALDLEGFVKAPFHAGP